jgi:hypothetical protein
MRLGRPHTRLGVAGKSTRSWSDSTGPALVYASFRSQQMDLGASLATTTTRSQANVGVCFPLVSLSPAATSLPGSSSIGAVYGLISAGARSGRRQDQPYLAHGICAPLGRAVRSRGQPDRHVQYVVDMARLSKGSVPTCGSANPCRGAPSGQGTPARRVRSGVGSRAHTRGITDRPPAPARPHRIPCSRTMTTCGHHTRFPRQYGLYHRAVAYPSVGNIFSRARRMVERARECRRRSALVTGEQAVMAGP